MQCQASQMEKLPSQNVLVRELIVRNVGVN